MTSPVTQTLSPMEAAARTTVETLLRRYATPITAALAVVVCVTGIMMFFKFYKSEVEAVHEWLGMAFVVATVLHLLRHRLLFVQLLTQRRTQVLFALTALVTAAFLFLAPTKAESPIKATVNAVLQAPLEDVAPVLGLTTDAALFRLREAGVANPSADRSLRDLARSGGVSPIKLLGVLGRKTGGQ